MLSKQTITSCLLDPPYQWDIEIEGADSYEYDGNLYQLTVRRDEANYFTYVWAKIDRSVDLYSREVILPKGVTPQQLSEISIQNMKTSENVAIAVALDSLDFNIETQGDGGTRCRYLRRFSC